MTYAHRPLEARQRSKPSKRAEDIHGSVIRLHGCPLRKSLAPETGRAYIDVLSEDRLLIESNSMPDLTNRCVDSVPGSQSHCVTTDGWGPKRRHKRSCIFESRRRMIR